MKTPILATKLYTPPTRPKAVQRHRLIERLNEGLLTDTGRLTLLSGSAGFGKTTLLSQWVSPCGRPAAWLSLDEGDNDPTYFWAGIVCSLQHITPNLGEGVLRLLSAPQRPSIESMLVILMNEITTSMRPFLLVLDDYHLIHREEIDQALTFMLEHLPPQMHLVIATRKDPRLPLARLRVRNQLTELRVSDLRFTLPEVSDFVHRTMGLDLTTSDVELLEARTEGWVTALQLAAISIHSHPDVSGFIRSFTGGHSHLLDYLVEEVLQHLPESTQAFLLQTSILDRLCGPLCEAVASDPYTRGNELLVELDKANLFVIPLDHERHWYRYHHLFSEMLKQRLLQAYAPEAILELHKRASRWYEQQGLEIEAFHHAVAADDIADAARLLEGGGMPLHFRGGMNPALHWLNSLPSDVLAARPSLSVILASIFLMVGKLAEVEPQLEAAEASMAGVELNDAGKDLIGHIASIRASLGVTQHHKDMILEQSNRALEHLHPANLPVRTATQWTLGYAYQLQGDRRAAAQAYAEAITNSQAIGHTIITISSIVGMGSIQESDNQLELASASYHRAIELAGEPPYPIACEAHLGLARIHYEWNELEVAENHVQQSMSLAKHLEPTDRPIACELVLARILIARRDLQGAAALLTKADYIARQHKFEQQFPEITRMQVHVMLHQGRLEAAAERARTLNLPLLQAKVYSATGDHPAALAVLEAYGREVEAKGWEDERLRVMIAKTAALFDSGARSHALGLLDKALTLAEPARSIRSFLDEGDSMAKLLSEASGQGRMTPYISALLAAFESECAVPKATQTVRPLIEPLTPRELTVLRLIAKGLSNQEISEQLFLALSTVKGYNQHIFGKLQVQRRTEAIARARELGLL